MSPMLLTVNNCGPCASSLGNQCLSWLLQLLENMTEVVRKGIQEAQVQLQKANEERLLEEVGSCQDSPYWCPSGTDSADGPEQGCILQGVLRQIPVVGSVLNWFSPVQASQKGRSFNLTAGRTSHWSMPRSVLSDFDQMPLAPSTFMFLYLPGFSARSLK